MNIVKIKRLPHSVAVGSCNWGGEFLTRVARDCFPPPLSLSFFQGWSSRYRMFVHYVAGCSPKEIYHFSQVKWTELAAKLQPITTAAFFPPPDWQITCWNWKRREPAMERKEEKASRIVSRQTPSVNCRGVSSSCELLLCLSDIWHCRRPSVWICW